ncbi:nucleotidyltransferase family protein [Prosthecomicrobium pneumaticum]|uniref:Nucleotidyltransferase n=1 Tax=Prosthecomicrobium pneumaticum TaxID=81895 RepID=A0A7W9FQI3_9HYPH|nr:nucleotidyltransferase family protein [Prosthecomicrobium pneumaticum]MBB5755023.1 hypothetical protein [Prosthecomicrobium pneumaticum]
MAADRAMQGATGGATAESAATLPRSRFLQLARLADPAVPAGGGVLAPLGPDDLADLLARADAHGVAPLVLRHLAARREPEVVALCAPLRAQAAEAAERAARLRKHAGILVARLRAHRLPAVPVGGTVFARRLYADPVLRPHDEIRLLLPKGVIKAVEHELSDLGFGIAPYQKGWERLDRFWTHAAEPSVGVRLLGDLVPSPRLRRHVTLDYAAIAGEEGPTAAERPARLLAVAAVTATVDGPFGRLIQLVDVLQAARGVRSALEELALDRLAEKTGARTAIVAALDLSARVFGDRQPAALAAALGHSRYTQLARRLLDPGAIAEPAAEDAAAPGWRRAAFRFLLTRTPRRPAVSPSSPGNAIASKRTV